MLIHTTTLEMESDSSRTARSSALAEGSTEKDHGRTLVHVVYVWYTLCTCGTHCVRVLYVWCMCNAGTHCVRVYDRFLSVPSLRRRIVPPGVGAVGRYEPLRKRTSSDITGGRVPLDV